LAELAKAIEGLSAPELNALLSRLRAKKGQADADRIECQPRNGTPFPLSFGQQRIWFLAQLDPGNPAYNVAGAITIEGPLRAGVLALALREVVSRHEALRARFPFQGGQPVQVVEEPGGLDLPLVDLGGLPLVRRRMAVRSLEREAARRPFHLEEGGLLRVVLLRLAEHEHRLLLVLHHIVADAWSAGLLMQELGSLYGAFACGEPSPLAELPVQYVDFAVWQRQHLLERQERQLEFWRRHLAELPALELPADRLRPAAQSLRGARQPLSLPAPVAAALARFDVDRVTPFVALMSVFATLLLRYSGQEDVAVGAPVSSRRLTALEGSIGFFANTLVLRTDLAGDPSFRELMKGVRDSVAEALSHQDLPFERLVEELAVQRELGHSPLVRAMFAFQSAPLVLELSGLALQLEDVDNGTAKLDLLLNLVRSPAGFSGYFEYSTDLFDAPTIARAAGHFRRLVEAAVTTPDLRLSELAMLGVEERWQLLAEWNDTAVPTAGTGTLHEMFELQAARTPDALAVAGREARLTYRELGARARQLASFLHAQGVGPETAVAICLERSCDMVVAILGVLATGGAYVPLDPSYPADRLAFMLADSGAAVVISRASLRPAAGPGGARTVLLDTHREALAAASPDLPAGLGGPDHLAYIIYTSGSTGRPKGVTIRHGSAVARMGWAARAFSVTEIAGVLAATSICFDLSIFELFVPLTRGGTVILADNVLELPELPMRGEVTLLNTVPSAMAELARGGALPASLRVINLAGEAFPPALAGALAAQAPDCRLLNLYGPSEDTTYSTWATVSGADLRPPAIGRPLEGTCNHVLGRRLELAPLGASGELYIGGEGLARGYFRRPELTAERFIPDPFAAAAGGRLYRTGDLARRRPDGSLEFLGRLDHQVKVRGFRIELGEVEAALAALPQIREAVVVALGEGGQARLVAYVVPAGAGIDPAELRAALARRLPAPMVPSLFVALPELLHTPNGKIDRRALPVPVDADSPPASATGPRNPVEEMVATIFAELLGRERVGIFDSFFDLGGHSLLVTRLVSRLGDAFQTQLPVRAIFETPTAAALAERLDSELRRLPVPPVQPGPRPVDPQLSFGQERLWFLHQMAPESALYNLPFALRLRGPLEVAALFAGLAAVSLRHESLRTSFAVIDERPVQRIAPEAALPPAVCDLAALPVQAREWETQRLTAAEARRPFDLARGPLARCQLVRLAAEDHLLLLNLHHAICDGWSLGILVRELGVLYRAAGRPSPLVPLPVQYIDYARWQREWLRGEVLEEQLAYWRRRLAMPPVLDLPTDRPRPARRAGRGGTLAVELPGELVQALRELGRIEGVTLFMVILAGFQALLTRHAGCSDVAVGAPIAHRARPELEGLIGFFVNTLVLRVDLAGDPPLRGLLAAVRETALGAYSHLDLPFEKLVEELQPERDASRTAFIQCVLVLQNVPLGALELPGVRCEAAEVPTGTAKFDLTLGLRESGQGLTGVLEYDRDLFDAATVQRLMGQLQNLLWSGVRDPAVRLSGLSTLSAAEAHQIGAEWNDAGRRFDAGDGCLHFLFEAQVRLTPGAMALVAAGETLSYSELNARANQLARRLRRLGVGYGDRVGLCLQRSAGMVVGLLAVLKAGAAYVPLDPDNPRERLAFMLADSRVRALVTQSEALASLPAADGGSGLLVLYLDTDGELLARESTADLESFPSGGALAYMIYTSGSTGRPKGVESSHRGIVNRLLWMQETFPLQGCDRVLQKTPFSFDVSIPELFWPLLAGARLVVARPGGHQDPAYLAQLIADQGVTTAHFVPSMLQAFIEEPGVRRCRSLRLVMASGEALPFELKERFFARFAGVAEIALFNLYGPTEASVEVTFHRCVAGGDREAVPIGRPVANTRIHLLDRHGRLVALGVTGELHIAGLQVARGYLGRPDLTAERFVPDALGREPGARLYRTGDLARHLPSGEIEYLGRTDHQVKLRGFRIELGEIEAALASHPGIREAAVLARADGASETRLVAYFVSRAVGVHAPVPELRPWLAKRLPDYMLPAVFVELDALPLTISGKVDRGRLPAPPDGSPAAPAAARTPVEELVCGLAAALLGVDELSPAASFFGAGGHSLLAARLAARIRGACGIELPLSDLFAASTLGDLADRVETALRSDAGLPAAGPISRAPGPGPYPLSFSQERIWFLEQLDPGQGVYNMPAEAHLRGVLDREALGRALGEAVRRHDALRARFPDRAGRPEQIVEPAAVLALPRIDLSALPAGCRLQEAEQLAQREAVTGFDLAAAPLLRTRLLDLGELGHRLLFNVHHIVADAWSVAVLMREIVALYEAFTAALPSPLPELPIRYVDYAVWQRGQLTAPAEADLLAYWRQRLAGAPEMVTLPADRPRTAVSAFRGGRRFLGLGLPLSAEVGRLARRLRATPFMVLLAAVNVLLQRQTGSDDVIVGFPIAVRSRTELEGIVGIFLNTLPLRVDLGGDPEFGSLVERVRDGCLEAYARQDLPFERILAALRPDREVGRGPLFQVLFNMLDLPRSESSAGGLEIEISPPAEIPSKFDLTFYVTALGEEGIGFHLVYNAHLFDAERIEDLLEQLRGVLAQAAEAPGRRLGELSLVTAAAAARLPPLTLELAATWPGAAHERLAEQARRQPDAPAVVDGGETWSYRDLEAESSRLARLLTAGGVQPEEAVAVYGLRSAPLVAALLGVLKARAAFLILDPAYPALRLIDRLRIASPRSWIRVAGTPVPEELARYLDTVDLRCRIELDLSPAAGLREGGPERAEDLEDGCGPGALAYVAFTSGSTGEPKALLGDHGPLSHFLHWHAATFAFTPWDRFAMLSGLAHDPLLRDVFTPLWVGATLCVPEPEDVASPSRLAAWMRQQSITVVHLTPALSQVLAAAGPDASLPALRYAFFGGAPLSGLDTARLRRLAPAVTCVNFYGTTETPQAMSVHVVASGEIGGEQPVPLGRGIDGVQLLVLRGSERLCGIGELGEIHVRTPYLTRGYLDDDALTGQRFLVSPFTCREDDRMYRTGDLGRYRPDGEVAFARRADRQCQVRGFRVEPAEIEAALCGHPAVREAVVVARAGGSRGDELVAYVVATARPPAPGELRSHLLRRLPEHAVPSAFVALAGIPLTPNGKVDVRALPAPAGPSSMEEAARPRTPVEELLAGIFAEVLEQDRVGLEDDFFERGGHSLLATQVVARVRDALGVELPVRSVFQAPTVQGLAAQVEREMGTGERRGHAAIPPLDRHRPLPLSSAQLRLWFLDQMESGSPVYNIPLVVRVTGPFDSPALAAALTELMRRHEALRTSFAVIQGEPVQLIARPRPVGLPQADLAGLPGLLARAEAERLIREEARSPFDLSRAPLLRALVATLAPERWLVLVTLHHIVADAWSMGILLREVAALFGAASRGGPSPLPELEIQYADFAGWQRGWLASEAPRAQIDYWKKQLAGAPKTLELPTDRPRPAVPTYRGSSFPIPLPEPLSRSILAMGRNVGATLFMVLISAFDVLLGRHTGQRDLVVGSPIAGRSRRETEGLIGCFVNTLALRVDLSGDPTWRRLLQQVRRITLEAYGAQDLPFERLVEELQPARDLGRTPVFQVMCALQNVPSGPLAVPPLQLEPLILEVVAAKFDLTLSVEDTARGLVGTWEYSRDLFDGPSVRRMAAHFENVLAAAASDPDLPLSRLPLLSAAERHEVLSEWNDSARDYPREHLIHELFEAQVRRSPGAVAVTFRERLLTYAELNARANRLAHWLRAHGVRQDVLVAVLAERSLEMIIALLGILKAGGAYAPLEPQTPPQRLRFLLSDLDSPVLLTQGALLLEVEAAGGFSGPVLCLDAEAFEDEREDDPDFTGDAAQLAYINYTSGSTGAPKGVIVPHRGVTRLVCDPNYMRFGPGERFLQLSTYAWDAATWEIWGALLHGGCLVMIARETVLDFPALARTVVEERITALYLTTALFNQVIDFAAEGLTGLRTLIVGGETASVPHFRRAVRLLPETRIINEYGPTENTSFSSWELVTEVPEAGALPIGRPLSRSRAYVLDRELEPVPVGVAGELLLGGDGLARGYLRRPDLTAERFVPSPLGAGERLYRSGDLSFWGADGRLGFLGRTDFQIKIRGHRIELAEVEEAVKRHPAVLDVVVVGYEPTPQDRQLAAYVVPRTLAGGGVEGLDAAALRSFLKSSLPDYMVPAAFMLLESLPLSSTGKVDRRALPAPRLRTEDVRAAPRTAIEIGVAGLWSELLPGGAIGSDDDFFDLGGHSLLATRLMIRIQETFGVRLELRSLFESPTVAAQAREIEAARQRGGEESETAPEPQPAEGEFSLSSAQQRVWFAEQLEPGTGVHNLMVALRLAGRLDVAALISALREVVRRHSALRTTFHSVAGEPVQRVAREAWIELPWVDLRAVPPAARETEARRLTRSQRQVPFALEVGPLLRLHLLDLAAEEAVLCLTVHHLVADGWSLGLLARELSALYDAAESGGPPSLAAPLAQYPDFVAWERERSTRQGLERQIAYWKRRLGGVLEDLRLPGDHPRPAEPSRRGAYHVLSFPGPLAAGLLAVSRQTGASLFMTLLAAYSTLLHLYSGQEDIVVGSPVATRLRREFESSIGLYINTVALRNDLSGNPTFRELLARVREVCLGAYAHADLPFEKLVDALGFNRDSRRAPLYRVWFVLQNTPPALLTASGLSIELLPPEDGMTKFDLALNLVESEAGLRGRFEYNVDQFAATTIASMAGRFEAILCRIAADPQVRIAELRQDFEDVERRSRQATSEQVRSVLQAKLKLGRRGRSPEN
jgi:amino acid adenylation domain-containing protein